MTVGPRLASALAQAMDWTGGAAAWANGKLSDPRRAAAVVVASTLAVFLWRLPAALSVPAGGADYGHYLATAHWLTGAEPTQFGHEGLIGYHLLLVLLIHFLPEPTATAVSGPLVASLLLPATYAVSRRAVSPVVALAAGGLVALQQNLSDMVAWGGNPNMLAMAFALVMWRYALPLAAAPPGSPWRRDAALMGLFLGLTVVTHSFTAFITLVELAAFWACAALLLRLPLARLARTGAVSSAVAALVSLPAAPMYLTTATSGVLIQPVAQASAPAALLDSVGYLFRDTPYLWLLAALVTAAAAAWRLRARDPFGLFLAAAAVVPVLLALTVFSGLVSRSIYFLDAPLAIGLCVGAAHLWNHRPPPAARARAAARRPAVLAVAVAALVLVPVTTLERQEAAVGFYIVMDDDHLAALDWLRDHSLPGQGVWTDGVQGVQPYGRTGQMYGFWIDGYARRPSMYTAQPEDLAFDYEQQRATDACRVHSGDLTAENGLLRLGFGANISSSFLPTVAVRSGTDYRMVFAGLELGLEAGARTHYLSGGANATPTATQSDGGNVTFRTNATFAAPNNWSGVAGASATLQGGHATYRVDARGDGRSLPWIHQSFLVLEGVRLDEVLTDNATSTASYRFALQGSGRTESHMTVTFAAGGEQANLSTRIFSHGAGQRIQVTVSGRSADPSLHVDVDWSDGASTYGAPGPVHLSDAPGLLDRYGVRYLFIENAQADLIRRFQVQQDRYTTAFENAAVTILERAGHP